ncbi:MAG: hypothetical protein HYZ33_00755 [Ignavibacteriales bacterium]|nr:hypothetical protein [Ignavibacteriales bacterium]
MKQFSFIFLFALLIALVGCAKDDVVTPPATDDQAIEEMLTSVDSVSEFSESDEATISDPEEMEWEKYGFNKATTPVKVFKWGRRVNSVDRNVNVTRFGDTMAVALLTKVFHGNLVIAASYEDTAHHADTIIRKPFHERIQRKVIFARIANSDNPRRNWKPVAISLVAGGALPDSVNLFTIEKLEVFAPADTYTVTEPLNTWLRLGNYRDHVPVVRHGDSVIVRLTVVSSDDSAEAVALRWAAEQGHFRERVRLVSTTPVSGGYERVYERTFRAHLPFGRFIGRYNVVLDVHSWGSLNDDAMPVSNRLWGFPYDVRRGNGN